MEIDENARNITFIKRHHFLKVYPKCTHTKNNPPCESQEGWFLHDLYLNRLALFLTKAA